MSSCPPRFTLVQLIAGDLASEERAEAERHIEACRRCAEKLTSLRRNVETFEEQRDRHLRRLTARLDAERARPGVSRRRWGPRWIPAVAAPVAAAAALLLLVWLPVQDDEPAEGIRFKGALSARIVAKSGDKQFIVKNGAQIAEGDALRFILTTSSAGYVTVFSVDARHRPSPLYPEGDPADEPSPLRLEPHGRHVLPGSIILDSSVGPEQIVIVFSDKTFRRDQVHDRIVRLLKKAGADAIDARRVGLPTVIFSVHKVRARR